MSEEAPVVTETQAESASAELTPSITTRSMADIVVSDQGLPEISEAELRGEDQTGDAEEPQTGLAEETETKAEDGEVESKETETTPPKTEPPPKGFVPTAALKEAREENRQLKDRLRQLEAKSLDAPLVSAEVPVVNPDFKVLSKTEFLELSEESPREALVYMQELQEHKDALRAIQEQETLNARRAQEVEGLFEEAVEQMSAAVPGLFDENSTAQQELATFAEDIGFSKDLFYLTNPETQIILPGEKTPLYLGSQAASIIKMLATVRNKVGATPVDTIRKSIEAELRPKIEAEVLSKIKSGTKKPFVSLTDIPTSASTAPLKGVLTEAEYARLSPSEQKAYLSGNM